MKTIIWPHLALTSCILIIMLCCQQAVASDAATDNDLSFQKLKSGDLERTFYLHLPPDQQSSASLPVMLVLHGGGKADGAKLAERTGYNAIADRERFIVVYPNGIDNQWNDGRGVTFRKADNTRIDDVGFISALIDLIIRDYKGDPRRVYVTGLSNGGMMALRLGCELDSKITAIAPVIANMPQNIMDQCRPDNSLPVLQMNGTADPLVPWNGGSVRFLHKRMGEVVSTDETVQFWAKHNQCSPTPVVRTLQDKDTTDSSRVIESTYTCKDNKSEVILYAIEGGGHTFPGSNVPDRPRLVGKKNNDIDGAEIIWNFFKRHRK